MHSSHCLEAHLLSLTPDTSQRPLLGIGLKVTSLCLLVTMMVAIKLVHDEVPIGQIIFVRSIVGLATVYLYYAISSARRRTRQLTFNNARDHLPWALTAAAAMTAWFTAITLIPLPEATAIGFIMPLLVVAFAFLILGEKIRLVRSVAVASGLVGVTIIVWPRLGIGADYTSIAALGAALSLFSATLWALAQIRLRVLTKTETSASSVISFSVASLLLSLVTIPFGWNIPTAQGWACLALCGVAGGSAVRHCRWPAGDLARVSTGQTRVIQLSECGCPEVTARINLQTLIRDKDTIGSHRF